MNPFDKPLRTEWTNRGESWITLGELTYTTDEGVVVTIPSGYKTDLASVPRFAWFWLAPQGRHQYAALLHDFLYDQHHLGITRVRRIPERPDMDLPLTKAWADAKFLEAMKRSQIGAVTRAVMYWAVRLFGGAAWNKGIK